jgi:hypothetical protein
MRTLTIFIAISALFLVFLCPAQATKGPKMEDIYGEELLNVPPVIRLKFQNDTGKVWSDTAFDERQEFLVKWQEKRNASLKEDENRANEIKDEKKALQQKERIKDNIKRNAEKVLREKEKAKQKEKQEEERKKRELNKKRDKAMGNLKKAQAARNR